AIGGFIRATATEVPSRGTGGLPTPLNSAAKPARVRAPLFGGPPRPSGILDIALATLAQTVPPSRGERQARGSGVLSRPGVSVDLSRSSVIISDFQTALLR